MTKQNETIINTWALIMTIIVAAFTIISALGGFVWFFSEKVTKVEKNLMEVLEPIKLQGLENKSDIKVIKTVLKIDKDGSK